MDNKENIIYLLGNIEFTDPINEQEIEDGDKRFKSASIGQCKVEIYGSEGSIPHMHIFNVNKSFNTCICIHSNNYFSHGGKYRDKFTSKQCKEFNNWLKKINSKFIGNLTNWEVAAGLWEVANPDCKFNKKYKVKIQPNYETMINFKDLY